MVLLPGPQQLYSPTQHHSCCPNPTPQTNPIPIHWHICKSLALNFFKAFFTLFPLFFPLSTPNSFSRFLSSHASFWLSFCYMWKERRSHAAFSASQLHATLPTPLPPQRKSQVLALVHTPAYQPSSGKSQLCRPEMAWSLRMWLFKACSSTTHSTFDSA